MAKPKKYESGGLSEAEKYEDKSSKRKPLPSETIKENENAKATNESIKDVIVGGIAGAPGAIASLGKRAYENVMGTKAQNEAADAREKARARANPSGPEAKFRDAIGAEYKKGGKVSSASKRADGCAVRGKTKGRYL